MSATSDGKSIMAIYEVTYSTKAASKDELSYSDVVLVEAETHEELTGKVVDLIRKLGPPGNYYVDSIGGNPYEPRPKKRIARKITKDLDNLVSTINALILRRNLGP
jgi:hypothetical protein